MSGKHNAKDIYGDGEVPGDADLSVRAPEDNQLGADPDATRAPEDGADTAADGSLSPGSTATGAGTVLE